MPKKLTRIQYRRRKRLKRLCLLSALILVGLTGVALLGKGGNSILNKLLHPEETTPTIKMMDAFYDGLNIQEMLLTPNEYSRPQTELKKIKGVVIHYTANPGTDAKANRNYFEGLKDGKTYSNGKYIYTSSNFIVGLKGNIIQCIPTDEVAYASNDRNEDTLSIEVCHPDGTGKFTKKSYQALVKLTAWICSKYNLQKEDILRHYDITGKACPKFYVENEEEWEQFKEEVFALINENAE